MTRRILLMRNWRRFVLPISKRCSNLRPMPKLVAAMVFLTTVRSVVAAVESPSTRTRNSAAPLTAVKVSKSSTDQMLNTTRTAYLYQVWLFKSTATVDCQTRVQRSLVSRTRLSRPDQDPEYQDLEYQERKELTGQYQDHITQFLHSPFETFNHSTVDSFLQT